MSTNDQSRPKRPPRPRWRSIVDGVDQLITPPANGLVRTTLFTDLLAAVTRLEVQIRRRAERQTTMVWHLWNLPTAGDMRTVRAQLAVIEGRIRDMSERLDDQERQG